VEWMPYRSRDCTSSSARASSPARTGAMVLAQLRADVVRIDRAWPWGEAITTAHAASRRSPFPDHHPIQRPGNSGHRPAAGPGTTPGHPRRRLPARSPRTARIRTLVTKDQG
jgi:hypothetical protein